MLYKLLQYVYLNHFNLIVTRAVDIVVAAAAAAAADVAAAHAAAAAAAVVVVVVVNVSTAVLAVTGGQTLK